MMQNWRWNPINGVLVFQTLLLATRTKNLYISLEELAIAYDMEQEVMSERLLEAIRVRADLSTV